jgi:adenylate cyclase class IV
MAYDNIEIEIKHPLQNPSEVMEFLNNNAELVKSNIFQKDTYYTL